MDCRRASLMVQWIIRMFPPANCLLSATVVAAGSEFLGCALVFHWLPIMLVPAVGFLDHIAIPGLGGVLE